jgi:hypothetical protein
MTGLLFAFRFNTSLLQLTAESHADALEYVRLVEGLRSVAYAQPQAPFAFRILPAAIVAATGLDPTLGFFVLDVAAILGTGLLLLPLLRPWVTPAGAVMAVVGWSVLPYSIRLFVNYPILPDALAAFLFVALLMAAHRRNTAMFVVLLVAGVLTRENLLFVGPLFLLRTIAARQPIRFAILAPLPAAAALAAVHLWPPVAPANDSLGTVANVAHFANALLTNEHDEAWRALAAPLFALGALVGVLVSRSALAAIRSEPGWLYLVVTGLAIATIGGGDHDRYIGAISPLLVLVGVRAVRWPIRTQVLAGVAAIQVVAARLLVPLSGEPGAPPFLVGYVPVEVLAFWSVVVLACSGVVAAARILGSRSVVPIGVGPIPP